jgi:two-component system, LuxR family, response regulator FixJ
MNRLRTAMGANRIILVVDGDSAVIDSLKFMLGVEGFEVRAYRNVHEVLNNVNELLNEDDLAASSCLVVDYHLPTMNGLELVAQLRDRRILIPAILVTSLPSEDLRNRAAAAGVSIVEKPLLASHLFDSIREVFAKSSL